MKQQLAIGSAFRFESVKYVWFCLFDRLTFLVCSVGFTSPMLFDEKKQPYHLMLQKFVSCGGQSALFQ